MTIRIVLADDHKMFRQTLRLPLELEADLEVVAEAGTAAELFSLLKNVEPDVLVLDIGLPDMNGIEAAREVAKLYPEIRIVALSGYTDRMFVDEMMKAGAMGFVAKSAGSEELVAAVRAAREGKRFLSPELSSGGGRPALALDTSGAPPLSVLGRREQEVLRLLAEGRSSPEIAAALGISPATADVHRRNIKQKTGLSSIAELTRYAIREGLVSFR